MLSSLKSAWSRLRHEDSSSARRGRRPSVEPMEKRTLFAAPRVTSVIADNRGEVFVNLDPATTADLDVSTITKSSALLYTAGPDARLGTSDDVRLRESVYYNASANRIVMRAKIAAGTGYRVRLIASRIKTLASESLDGEFTGAFPSGNGTPGGDFNCQTKNDRSTTPAVRMSTTRGIVLVRLNTTAAPKTTSWFLSRANAGTYDSLIFTKNIAGSLVGAGSLQVTSSNTLNASLIGSGLLPETTGLSNGRGTIAMDRIPIDPSRSGNGFVFNTATNSSSNLSVFGTVSSGLAALDAINALQAIDLSKSRPFVTVDLKTVPVNDLALAQSGFDPSRDGVIVRRTAVQMKIGKL